LRELLLGCGSRTKIKKIHKEGSAEYQNVTTVDINKDHSPDIVWDLNELPYPFEAESFDEIHCYDVLEHLGSQGDYKFFFAQFNEFWRILRPNGIICGTVPKADSVWAWGDPGHTRVITKESFIFLDRRNYKQIGESPMTDYRFIYKGDFQLIHEEYKSEIFYFGLLKKGE